MNNDLFWLNVDLPVRTRILHLRDGCSDERRKGRGVHKPVGSLGRDGGWFSFATAAEAGVAAEQWRTLEPMRFCRNCTRDVALADLDDSGVREGAALLKMHIARERNRLIVEKKRAAVLSATGVLSCEACGFDFSRFYGPLGHEYCEVHHLLPFAEVEDCRHTRLEDLAVVCSNCHRMVHRSRPCLSIAELQSQIETTKLSDEHLGPR